MGQASECLGDQWRTGRFRLSTVNRSSGRSNAFSPSGESPARSGYFYPVNLELAAAAVAALAAAAAAAAAVI